MGKSPPDRALIPFPAHTDNNPFTFIALGGGARPVRWFCFPMRPPRLLTCAFILVGLLAPLAAMTVNVASPYNTTPSRPRSPDVLFTAPAHEDFLFTKAGDTRLICHTYLRAFDLKWTLSHERVKKPLLQGAAEVRRDNSFALDLPLADLAPGFYSVSVTINIGDTRSLRASTTIGWRVDELAVHAACPEDFDAYWATQLATLDSIAPAPELKLARTFHDEEINAYNLAAAALPANYDPAGARTNKVDLYRVHFASVNGATIEGWFAKPAGPGPFPALLILPGAGNGPRPAPLEHARHGYAALDIQVHGSPVDTGKNKRYADTLSIYLNALQAARALKQLPDVDPERMAVLGGSQGGRLTLVVAALDPSFKAAVPALAHSIYQPWRRWTQRLNDNKDTGTAAGFTEDATSSGSSRGDYFDALNFAPRITCPVLMNVGLIDPLSPPTSVYAAYLTLGGPKQIIVLANTGHDWAPAFDRFAWRWLNYRLDTGLPPR